jgi:hypothetical protein
MMDFERSKIIKESAQMPAPYLSPFLPLEQQLEAATESKAQNSLFDSKLNNDLLPVRESQEHSQHQSVEGGVTVLQQYVIDLIASGKTQDEVIQEIGAYYYSLTSQADQEILQL